MVWTFADLLALDDGADQAIAAIVPRYVVHPTPVQREFITAPLATLRRSGCLRFAFMATGKSAANIYPLVVAVVLLAILLSQCHRATPPVQVPIVYTVAVGLSTSTFGRVCSAVSPCTCAVAIRQTPAPLHRATTRCPPSAVGSLHRPALAVSVAADVSPAPAHSNPFGWQSGSGQSKQLSATKHPSGTLKLNNACLVSLDAPSGTDTVIAIVSPTHVPDAGRCGSIPNTPTAPDSTIPPPGARGCRVKINLLPKRRHAGRISRKCSCMTLPILVG